MGADAYVCGSAVTELFPLVTSPRSSDLCVLHMKPSAAAGLIRFCLTLFLSYARGFTNQDLDIHQSTPYLVYLFLSVLLIFKAFSICGMGSLYQR